MKGFEKLTFICIFLILLTSASILSCFYKECSFLTPHISIIIPVYNTENCLDECLSSARNQIFKNIEIICINDESKDNSLKVLKQHRKKDRRVKIVNQQHQGLSAARNMELKKVRGEYILFLDSDDVILPNTCEFAY